MDGWILYNVRNPLSKHDIFGKLSLKYPRNCIVFIARAFVMVQYLDFVDLVVKFYA